MKKLILAALLATSLAASGQNFTFKSFLNGWGLIVLTNSTVAYGNTNVPYIDLATTNLVFSLTNSYYKALINSNTAAGTFSNNVSAPGSFSVLSNAWWTNAITQATNSDGTVLKNWGPAIVDVPMWSDRNGNPASLALTMSFTATNNVTGTNVLIFTFVGINPSGLQNGATPSVGGINSLGNLPNPENYGANTNFIVRGVCNGSSIVTIRTNLPTAYVQGVGGLRLLNVVSPANTTDTTPGYVLAVGLEGFVP